MTVFPGTVERRPEASDAVLEALDLYRFYRSADEETLALRGVSLQVRAGETVAVVGPSGCGKSTLLAILAGLDEPDGGTVRVAGETMSHRAESLRAQLRARSIGLLLQSRNLLPHLDVSSNLQLARSAARRSAPAGGPQRSSPDTSVVLGHVGLAGRERAYPSQLSGGELARAGLAVAMANEPPVLLADEPTGELDGGTEQQVLQLLAEQAGRGTAVLVVTHSPQVVAIADRVIALEDGRVA